MECNSNKYHNKHCKPAFNDFYISVKENHITICRGSLRSKRNQYPSYTRPVTIQIYTGTNMAMK